MKLIVFLTITISFLISVSDVKAESWNGIYPLKSTRSDVEKIMGECDNLQNKTWLCVYKFEDKQVHISYSEVGCSDNGLWNVPKETVTQIMISYEIAKRPTISELKINLKDFDKRANLYPVGQFNFFNRAKGIEFVAENEVIKAFYYTPSEDEESKYKCKLSN